MAKSAKSAKASESATGASGLDAVVAQIRKEFGDGSIMQLGEVEQTQEAPSISTGAFSLDLALGIGGLPRGCLLYTSDAADE